MKIEPFFEFNTYPAAENLLSAHGLELTALDADLTKENWIRVYATWAAKKDEYKFKYPVLYGSSSGYSDSAVNLAFPQLKYRYRHKQFSRMTPLQLSVGIQDIMEQQLKYSYRFFENLKYGVLVWFAPENWNNGEGDKNLFTLKK